VNPVTRTAEIQLGKRRRWYLTASHRVLGRDPSGPVEVPFDRPHLREPGDPTTACGEPALNWPIFWELPVVHAAGTCAACMEQAGLNLRQHEMKRTGNQQRWM